MQGQFNAESNTHRTGIYSPPGLVNFQKKGKLNWTQANNEEFGVMRAIVNETMRLWQLGGVRDK